MGADVPALTLALLGCGAPSAPPPVAPPPPPAPKVAADPDHQAKMRAVLKERLGDAYDRPVPGLEGASPARGQAVYDAHCGSCHGDGGQGADPSLDAGDFTDPAFRDAYSEAGRVSVIRDGLPGTAMPGFAGVLTEAQILDAYDFVRHLVALEDPP